MPSEPTEKKNQICATEGCGKQVRARGFCVACYYRLLRRGDIEVKTETKKWKHRLTNIDEENRTATCAKCGDVKIMKREANRWRCAKDSNERSRLYKKAYRESKKIMLGPKCEICGSVDKLCWDHNHTTGEFRGTLCANCNVALGLFYENEEYLYSAISYLRK